MIVLGCIFCLFALLAIVVMVIPHKPLIAEKEIILEYNLEKIWDIVVNNYDYKWRTDIKKIEIVDNGNIWLEYYDEIGKYFTKFSLTEKVEHKLYLFTMENKNFTGEWTGTFEKTGNNETKCVFTEKIIVKNKIMDLLAKIYWNINKIQEQYIRDLKNKLKE